MTKTRLVTLLWKLNSIKMIFRAVAKKKKKPKMKRSDSQTDEPMEGSNPALPAEPGTLKVAALLKPKSFV